MIILELNWEQKMQDQYKSSRPNERREYNRTQELTLASKIKTINKLIATGQAIYKKEKDL